MKLCLTDGCESPRFTRGLCQACYHAARRAIKTGRTTEEQLIAMNMLLPSSHCTGPSRFIVSLELKELGQAMDEMEKDQ